MASLEELRDRITADVPASYVEYLQSHSKESVAKQGFDPTTLLVLNLELAGLEDSYEHKKRFFIDGDGCGNYLFVDSSQGDDRVQLWVHDASAEERVEQLTDNLPEYLATEMQECRIDFEPAAGKLYLSRTSSYGESILAPIKLDEWIAAVKATEGIEYRGYREGKNPFTGQMNRFTTPGYSIIRAGEKELGVHLIYGRVELGDSPESREIASSLAEQLGAYLISGKD